MTVIVGDEEFKSGASVSGIWCATNEPPNLTSILQNDSYGQTFELMVSYSEEKIWQIDKIKHRNKTFTFREDSGIRAKVRIY